MITLEQVHHAVMMSHEEGFFITGSFMLGAPTETAEEMEQTTSFARIITVRHRIVQCSPLLLRIGFMARSSIRRQHQGR